MTQCTSQTEYTATTSTGEDLSVAEIELLLAGITVALGVGLIIGIRPLFSCGSLQWPGSVLAFAFGMPSGRRMV